MTTAITGFTSTEDRLRTVLRIDGAVTAAVGLLALETPLAWYGDTPAWLVRTIGALLLVTGVDLALLTRASGRLLRVGATVTAELAFAWVLATVVVLLEWDLPTQGTELLTGVGLVTLGFGIAYTRLVRGLR